MRYSALHYRRMALLPVISFSVKNFTFFEATRYNRKVIIFAHYGDIVTLFLKFLNNIFW